MLQAGGRSRAREEFMGQINMRRLIFEATVAAIRFVTGLRTARVP